MKIKTHRHDPNHSLAEFCKPLSHISSIEFPIFDCSETIAGKNFKCRPIEMALTIDPEGNSLNKQEIALTHFLPKEPSFWTTQ